MRRRTGRWSGRCPHRQALTLTPYEEDLIAALATTLFRSGDRAGALLELQTFITRFRTDLELAPGPETRGLLDQLMAEREGWAWTHDQQVAPEYALFQADPDFLAFFRPRG